MSAKSRSRRAAFALFCAVAVQLLATGVLLPVPRAQALGELDSWTMKRLDLPLTHAQYVPSRGVAVATVASTHPALGNELVELNPYTGALGRHVFVGSNPYRIAVSDDGKVAYVALAGANAIAEVNLVSFQLVDTFDTPVDDFLGETSVQDLAVTPGRSDTVVATLTGRGGVIAYRDGEPMPNDLVGYDIDEIEFHGATTIYGYENSSSGFAFSTIVLDDDGLTFVEVRDVIDGYYTTIEPAGGELLTTNYGIVFDPVSGQIVHDLTGVDWNWTRAVVEATPGRLTYLSDDGGFYRFDTATGDPVGARRFGPGYKGYNWEPTYPYWAVRDLVAVGPNLLVTTSHESAYLVGPAVNPVAVSYPKPAPSTLSGLVETHIPLAAHDLIFDPTRNLIYANVAPGQNGGGRVVALDATTGIVLRELLTSEDPDQIAVSDDFSTMYVGVRKQRAVMRVDLTTFLPVASFGFGESPWGNMRFAGDIAVRPGHPDTVAISVNNDASSGAQEFFAIYRDGVRLPDMPERFVSANTFKFADRDTLYAANNWSTGFNFYRLTVDDTGAHLTDEVGSLTERFHGEFEFADDGHIWSDGGDVVDPAQLHHVARLDLPRFVSYNYAGGVEVHSADNRAFLVTTTDQTNYDTNRLPEVTGPQIVEYELDKYRPIAIRPLDVAPGATLITTPLGLAATAANSIILFYKPLCLGHVPTITEAINGVITGTPGPDVISGTPGADAILGLGGDDLICGLGGNDSIVGGDGNDTLLGGLGLDQLVGGLGADDLDGGDGLDTVVLGSDLAPRRVDLDNVADDGMVGEHDNVRSTNERIIGAMGNDLIIGGAGSQDLRGRGGDDVLWGGDGVDAIDGGPGADRLFGGSGADVLYGGDGVDICETTDLLDRLMLCEQ